MNDVMPLEQKVALGVELRSNLDCIAEQLLHLEQVPCPVTHHFGPGVCFREVLISAGTFAIGHHHNHEHMNMMLTGRATFLNDDGTTSELTAPQMFISKPGRKIAFIHEDMRFINVFPTSDQDVEAIEDHYLTKSDVWLNALTAADSVKRLRHEVDIADFEKAISEYGFSKESVKEISENHSDLIDLPFGQYKIKVGSSTIEGKGLFATADIQPGEVIAPSRIGDKRTIAGRYVNHSLNPNAEMVLTETGMDLVATMEINGCRGGYDGEEITTDYRQALSLSSDRRN